MQLKKLIHMIFIIPPVNERRDNALWIEHFAVGGYKKELDESYILLKVFYFSIALFVISSLAYCPPIAVIISNIMSKPYPATDVIPNNRLSVESYMYDYPRIFSLAIVSVSLAYATLIAFLNLKTHAWRFTTLREQYSRSMTRLLHGRHGKIKYITTNMITISLASVSLKYTYCLPLYWNQFSILRGIHDFHDDGLVNYIVLFAIYGIAVSGLTSNIYAYLLLVAIERIRGERR